MVANPPDEPQPLTIPLLLRRGLALRCPLCGADRVAIAGGFA